MIRLGEASDVAARRRKAQRVTWEPPPPRESVDSGYEVVWYPHKDAQWLLSKDRISEDSTIRLFQGPQW